MQKNYLICVIYRKVLKLEYVSEREAAGRAEDVGGPPVGVHRVHLGEAVEVLHKLPEGRQLVRAVRGRIGGAKIISMNKNIFSPGYKK